MNTKTDAYHIKKTLKGDSNAFAHLVEKYQHMVFTLCFRIVKNREEAEEVSQDVFVKAYTKLGDFKGKSKFSTWLYRIAYYGSLDAVRRAGRQVNSEQIDAINEGSLGDVQDALDYLEAEERKKIINDALSKLSSIEKTILTLYYFEDLSVKDIVKVVDLSEENIKVKLFRSRKKLHTLLTNVVEPRTINLL